MKSEIDIIKSTINYNRFPNFLIIGANKGGTTSLHDYCQQHPEILMSKPFKEPMFFTPPTKHIPIKKQKGKLGAPRFITSLDQYQKLFIGGAKYKMRGESSTSYLASPSKAIPRIKAFKPDMKIIASIREPISRAISAYNMYNGAGLEKRNFDEIVQQEYDADFHGKPYSGRRYLLLGKYYSSISMYKKAFGDDNVLILNYDHLKVDSKSFIKKIYAFLNVDEQFTPELKELNVSGNWLKDKTRLKLKEVNESTSKLLEQYFKQDLELLKSHSVKFDSK